MRNAIVCDGHFRVYEDGTVMRIADGKEVLAPQYDVNGYRRVVYYEDGIQHPVYVHHLMAEGFLPPDDSRIHVNHLNGIKWDNRIENLERVTPSENMSHAYKTGLLKNYTCKLCGTPTHSHRYICHRCADKARKSKSAEESERKWKARREAIAVRYMDMDMSILTDRQAEIVWFVRSGLLMQEVADITGTTRQYISNVLKTVDTKVQKQKAKEEMRRMTLEELKASTKETVSPSDAAPLLGCTPSSISLMARYHPDLLGFEVSKIGNRTRISRASLIRFLENTPAEDHHL